MSVAPIRSKAATPQIKTQAPGFYRFMLGGFEITALLDGTAPERVDETVSDPDEVRRTLACNHEFLPLQISTNAFLINTQAHLVLVDSGAGEFFSPRPHGQLVANLRKAGYQAGQIDAVLLTHMHPDHCGGLIRDGQRGFPNGKVYVDCGELEFWRNQAADETVSAAGQEKARKVLAAVEPYIASNGLHIFDGATELFPGVQAIPEHGHSPGHTGYLIESRGEQLLLWGDIIHVAEVQFAGPRITSQYDVDPAAAIVARRKVLAEVASKGYIVCAAHISFPGLGHVRADGGERFTWIPLPYTALL